jgi:hypothetical protein
VKVQPEGVIVGGWSFVVAAYSVTAAVLLVYAWSLRSRLARTPAAREPRQRH